MRADALLALFGEGRKRAVLIGDVDHGVIAGLDLEGRLYPVLHGTVLVRVNPAAVLGVSGSAGYLNPGGDGLWPAPEGSRLGWHYATGVWRVPPGVTGARWLSGAAGLHADMDLVNAQGLGIPIRGERQVTIRTLPDGMAVTVEESFTYCGTVALDRQRGLLAPWTLCQFDCGPGCETLFPDGGPECVWDLYDPSDALRRLDDGHWRVRTDGSSRFQLGLSASVPWIEFRDPTRKLRVRRSSVVANPDHAFIDIADRSPHADPDTRGCRYSIYSDANGFMEIEAAGGMPLTVTPGARLAVTVTTAFHHD